MRILLDNNVDQRFARLLTRHEVTHARQKGWAELHNGDLIAAAEADGFAVMVTADKNMQYQQTIAGRKIAIIVLSALFIKWKSIEQLAPQVLEILDAEIPQGSFIVVRPAKT